MRLHYLRGDCSAAIASFEQFEQRLKDELGARPSAETIELLRTIEQGAAALPQRRTVVPASLMRPPRLIGRTAEIDALGRAWSQAARVRLAGRSGHRQVTPAARPCGAARRRGQRAGAAGRRRHRLRRAGAADARRSGAAPRRAAAIRGVRNWRWCCPNSGPPQRWPAKRSGCCCTARWTPRSPTPQRRACAPSSSTTCISPTTQASSSCSR